jgi:hypothetical protein
VVHALLRMKAGLLEQALSYRLSALAFQTARRLERDEEGLSGDMAGFFDALYEANFDVRSSCKNIVHPSILGITMHHQRPGSNSKP